MTNEEIRIKVAEACGWKPYKPITHDGWPLLMTPPGKPNQEGWLEPIPNYHEDLNACASFEATLTDEEQAEYWKNLVTLCNEAAREQINFRLFGIFYQITATAHQRCLAYLKTKRIIQ